LFYDKLHIVYGNMKGKLLFLFQWPYFRYLYIRMFYYVWTIRRKNKCSTLFI